MNGLARFLGRCCDPPRDRRALARASTTRARSALIAAQRQPERVERLALINALPLLAGYRWHWIARWFWRVPFLGELLNATATEARLRPVARSGSAAARAAARRVHRLGLTAAGRPGSGRRRSSSTAPPTRRCWRPRERGSASFAARRWSPGGWTTPTSRRSSPPRTPSACRDAELIELEGAGHWPWIDRPELVDRVVDFFTRIADRSVTRVFTIGARCARCRGSHEINGLLPNGVLDAGLQFFLFFARLPGLPGRPRDHRLRRDRRLRPRLRRDRPRALARDVLRARLPAGAARPHPVAGRLRELHVPELALRDHHRRSSPGSTCSATSTSTSSATCSWSRWWSPWSATRCYPTAPPRLFPGEGFTDTIATFTGVAQDSKTASLLRQPVRGGPEHAHRLLADDRRARRRRCRSTGSPRLAVDALPARRALRDRRDRQPLLARRRRRRARRRRSPRSPRSSSRACARRPGRGRRRRGRGGPPLPRWPTCE